MSDKKADKQFIIEFVEMYRDLPALWDVQCKEYRNRSKKAEQYNVLIGKYREKYPEAEKQEVVKKINSLRTNFRKELKRIHDAEKNGLCTKDVKPSLWYFEAMRFLQSLETPTTTINTMDIYPHFIDVNPDDERSETSGQTENDEPLKKYKRVREATNSAEEFMKLGAQRLQQPLDDSDKIAAAWAVDLRKMDPQQQLFAKKAISDILFEGQMGTLHRDSVEINPLRVSTPYSVQSLPSTPVNTPPFPRSRFQE